MEEKSNQYIWTNIGLSHPDHDDFFLYCLSRIILREAGLHQLVPVSHMNDHGSTSIRVRDMDSVFQK